MIHAMGKYCRISRSELWKQNKLRAESMKELNIKKKHQMSDIT